ncbi:MAG: oligosaccharide flippase family protein, partial [Dehalococcoidia bacterium]
MNAVQTIAKNITVLTIADITCTAIGFLLIMYVAHHLGAEGFGILSFGLAFTGIFVVFTDLGLSILTTREVARDKSLAQKYLGNIATLKIILCIPTFVLIAVTINLLGYSEQIITVVYLIALAVIFASFSTMLYSIFEAYQRMEFAA